MANYSYAMTITVSNIFEEAMMLSDDSRLDLAERLIASTQMPDGLLAEQIQVASDRMRALDEGRSLEIPSADAHAMVRKAVRERL